MIYEPCKAKTQECLNCTRPKCVYDTDTTEEQREAKRQYYLAHRDERRAYQHEYDMTHKRPCESCVWRSEHGCTVWDCDYISRKTLHQWLEENPEIRGTK